jgi:hypothetical protein
VGANTAGKIRRIGRKYGVHVSYKNTNTIKQRLVHLKEKMEPNNKKDVVYRIPLTCGKVYIGESGQLWGERKHQHQEAILKHDINKSAIVEHFEQCEERCQKGPPNVIWDEEKILAREGNIGIRRAMESLHIKLQNKKGGTVNRNSGQPELNSIWNKVIKKYS